MSPNRAGYRVAGWENVPPMRGPIIHPKDHERPMMGKAGCTWCSEDVTTVFEAEHTLALVCFVGHLTYHASDDSVQGKYKQYQ